MPALSSKHRATLAAVFARPTPATLEWARIEALFRALDAVVEEAAGSRVRIAMPEADTPAPAASRPRMAVATFHRPHPAKEARPYQVREARDLLTRAGITP